MNESPPREIPEPKTHQLERPLKFAGRKLIDNSIMKEARSKIYTLEYAQCELIDQWQTEVALQATALYWYTRFEGDSDIKASFTYPETSFETVPASARDFVKLRARETYHRIRRRICRRSNWILHHWPCELWPKRWQPKLVTFDVVTEKNWYVCIVRIQEALLAQIDLLRRLGIEPQAVLVCPQIEYLMAVRNPQHQAYRFLPNSSATFADLPVKVCDALKWGAIVV